MIIVLEVEEAKFQVIDVFPNDTNIAISGRTKADRRYFLEPN